MYPPNRIIRKHQQRASESRYLNHSTQCASVSRIRLQKGRRSAQPIAEHRHRPKMNFPIWDSPRPNLPQKFPPSPITNTQPTKNSPAPRTEQQPRPSHGDIHAAPIAREPDFVWKEGLLTVPRGKPWGGGGPRGGPSARRHRPVRRRRRRDRDRGRWEIWGFRVSDASTEQAWLVYFSICFWVRDCVWMGRPDGRGGCGLRCACLSCCAQTACGHGIGRFFLFSF